MTEEFSLYGHARSGATLTLSPSIQDLSSDSSRLILALANALCRNLSDRPSVHHVELKDGFVFVYTNDPAMRRVICVGSGERLDRSISTRFPEIAAFNPQFFDVLYLGRMELSTNHVAAMAYEWNKQRIAERDLNTMQSMCIAFQRLQNVWHNYVALLRDSSDIGEYLRRNAAFELRDRLIADMLDQDEYKKLVWSILRFSMPTCLFNGRTFFAYRDKIPGSGYLLFNVIEKSLLRRAMNEMGLDSNCLRFDLTHRNDLDQESVKAFGHSLARHPPSHPGFILSRRQPSWDFEAYTRDLRMGWKHTALMMALSDEDLLRMLANGENKRFEENEKFFIESMQTAFWSANQMFKYQIECESFRHCGQLVENTLYIGGLKKDQIRELVETGTTELMPEQVQRNWHVLSLEQRSAAHRGESIYIEEDLDTVCPKCGSDSVDHDD